MKTNRVKGIILAVVMALSLPMTAGAFDLWYAVSALAKGAQAYTLTNEEVIEIVKEAVKEMDASNRVAPASNAYAKRLARITSGFKKVGNTPLNFKVYITSDVNAFACADGSVRVFSGLMDLMTDDELIGIIGHEIGHVGKQHSFNAFKHDLYNSALIDALGAMSATVRNLADYGLDDLAVSMMSAKYSRDQEREADDYGYDFLKKCGKNPYNMVRAFEKMKKLSDSKSTSSKALNYINRMFSTHPQMDERITRMKNRARKDGYTR